MYVQSHGYKHWLCGNCRWSRILIFYCLPKFSPVCTCTSLYVFINFFFRKISGATASALSFLVSLVAPTGADFSRMCSCVSYFVTADSPCSLKFLSPVFSAYCEMMMWRMWFSLSSLVIFGVLPYIFRWMWLMSWVLTARVGINMVTCFLSLVDYHPFCSASESSSYSATTSFSPLSLSSLSIEIGYGVASSGGSTSLNSSFSSS